MRIVVGMLFVICMIAASVLQAGMGTVHAGVVPEAPHAGHHASHDEARPCHMLAPVSDPAPGHAQDRAPGHADAACPAWHACAALDGVPEARAVARRLVLDCATAPHVARWRAGVAPTLETPPPKA